MDCSTPGLPVPHHLWKFAQVHVHCIGDVIQPSYPLTSSSPSALNLSQHQGRVKWVGCSVTKILDVSASVLPMSIQGWFPPRLTGFISLLTKELLGLFLAPQFKGINSLPLCLLYRPAVKTICDHWEDHSLDYTDFVSRVSLLFNTLSRFVIAFLPRRNSLLISWLQSSSAVILEPKKRKSITIFTFPPSICHEAMGLDTMILDFF